MTENNNQKPILQPFLQDKTGESVPEIIDFYGAYFHRLSALTPIRECQKRTTRHQMYHRKKHSITIRNNETRTPKIKYGLC